MSTITFDTLKFVSRLEQSGISREHATAFVEAQRDALSDALDATLATKADFAEVKSELGLHRWMLGAVLALAVANFAKQYF